MSAEPSTVPGSLPIPVPGFRRDQLEGFRIGVTSDRRSEDLIDAFERRGAWVLHAPTLRTAHAELDAPLVDDTRAVIAARPDVVLATTSYGMRRWFETADAAGLGSALTDALGASAILVRGPKARGSIRAAGLTDAGMSEDETTASLVTRAITDFPDARTIVVQLHGYTDQAQLDRLRAAFPVVLTVAPYRWEQPEDDERVTRLIDAVCSGLLDCVTFTSAPAVDALFAAAEADGRLPAVVEALRTVVIAAAVGPITAAPLRAAGIEPIQPERFRMGALIRLVCEHLEQHRVQRVTTRHGVVELRGSTALVAGAGVHLPPTPLALLHALVSARGAVVSRSQLATLLQGPADDHAMEVALSRLRQSLGTPGLIATVVKRGYRLDV